MKKNLLFLALALMLGAFTFTGCATQSGGVGGGLSGDSERTTGAQEHGIIYNSATDQELGSSDADRIYDVFFDYDSYVLEGDARSIVENNGKVLRRNKGAKISIEGHCDDRGSNEYNIALGERRAKSVKKYLTRIGVSKRNITTVSYGEEKPFCKGTGSECWQKNRRAHFVVKY